MVSFALFFSLAVSAASLIWEFSAAGLTSLSIGLFFFALLWGLAITQNWDWFSSFGFLAAMLTAAFGLYLELSAGWMFNGGLFALFTWELANFRARLRLLARDEAARAMERRHLARLTLLAILGMGSAALAMFLVRASFPPAWLALLGALLIAGGLQLAMLRH